jgi:hypothetical protein
VAESNEKSTYGSERGRPRPGPPPGTARRRGRPAKPPLHAGRLLAAAGRVGRHDPWRILAVAIVVSAATAAAEIAAEHAGDPHRVWQYAAAAAASEVIALLGTVLLSGFLCRLTAAAAPGQEPVTLAHVIRTLPWGRLVLADILVSAGTIVGLLALVIPGLVLATLLAVVGPVIETEDRSARAALRRSARLVRPYFWRVALLATVPVIALSELETVGPEPHGAPAIAEVLAIRGVVEGLGEAVVGLVLIQLSYRLRTLDAIRERAADQAGGPAGGTAPAAAGRR